MSTKKTTHNFKTQGTWTTRVDEILIKHGLTPKWGNKTGSSISIPRVVYNKKISSRLMRS